MLDICICFICPTNLQEIRCIFRVCRDPFNDQMYSKLRVHLYKFGQRKLTGKQLQVLCEVSIQSFSIVFKIF